MAAASLRVQLFLALGWTVYVIYLPQLAAQAGLPKEHVPWLLLPDQAIFAAMDWTLGTMADRIHQPISPLSFKPKLPASRRFVYAGVADRIATPGPAHVLWEHWGRSSVLWYRGSHIGFAWSREVRQFIDDALQQSGADHGDSTMIGDPRAARPERSGSEREATS